MLPGVYKAARKDGTLYYRCSITYQNKHISLGSFEKEETAHLAYRKPTRFFIHHPSRLTIMKMFLPFCPLINGSFSLTSATTGSISRPLFT